MRQEVLEDLKNNVNANVEYYLKEGNAWISEKFDTPFLEFKRGVEDFELNFNSKDVGTSDMENVKILHSNLISLTRTEAADERLWAGLTHSIFWEYMIRRWEKAPVKKGIDIENRYFLRSKISYRRALIMNTLSRLWWIGELIYSPENKEDPYYLLEVFRGDFTTNIHTFVSSGFTSNPKISKAVLKSALNYIENRGKLSRKEFQGILRYANLLGGSYLLDYLDEKEIEEKIDIYIDYILIKESEKDVKEKTYEEQVAEKKGLFNRIKAAVLS